MAKFQGHLLAAAIGMIFGIRWTIAAIRRHVLSLNPERKKPYLSMANASCSCFPKLPLEGIAFLFLCTLGLCTHSIHGLIHNGGLNKEGQHISMYFFYAVFGLVIILKFYRYPLPPSSDYAALILAILMEAIALGFHLEGKTLVDKHAHLIELIIQLATLFVTFNEAYQRTCAVWSIARGILLTLHGTWYAQVAFSLYYPSTVQLWDENSHADIMKATNIFALHVALNLIFAGLIGCKILNAEKKRTVLILTA